MISKLRLQNFYKIQKSTSSLIFYLALQVEFCFFASFDDSIPDNDLVYIILISFVFSFRKVLYYSNGATS